MIMMPYGWTLDIAAAHSSSRLLAPHRDLAGHMPLPLGVAGHEGSTVIVGLNGLRLLRGSAWRKALNEGQTT